MNAKLCLGFAVLLAFESMDALEDSFCPAFRQNGLKFDYVLRQHEGEDIKEYTLKYYFFIAGQYWAATYKDAIGGSEPTFVLDKLNNKSTQFFTGQYYMALWMKFENEPKTKPLLFDSKNWTKISAGSEWSKETPLTDYKAEEAFSLVVKTEPKDRPKIIFSENTKIVNKSSPMRWVFIKEMSPNGYKVERYSVKKNKTNIEVTLVEGNNDDLKAIQTLRLESGHSLLTIVPQWTHNDEEYSHLYLFSDGPYLRYCMNQANVMNKCKKGLIVTQCGEKDQEIPGSESPEGDVTIIVIVAVVVAIVVIVVILIILFVCCRQQNSEEGALPVSSVDRKGTNRSGISKAPSSQAAKKSSKASGTASKKVSQTGSPAVASSSGQNK